METEKALQKLGLTETESKIYLSLMDLGESTAVMIAKNIKIHRRTIYDNLNILIKKGLVSYIIKNRTKYFKANNPSSFEIMLKEKRDVLDMILPELKLNYESHKSSLEIAVYEGVDGVKTIMNEIMDSKKTVYWQGSGGMMFELFDYSGNILIDNLKKIKLKMIHPDSPLLQKWLEGFPKGSTRVLPKESINSTLSYGIFEDTVVLGIIETKSFIAVKIKSEKFALGFKNYFKLMWNIAEERS